MENVQIMPNTCLDMASKVEEGIAVKVDLINTRILVNHFDQGKPGERVTTTREGLINSCFPRSIN